MLAANIEEAIAIITTRKNDSGFVSKSPNGTFIPIKLATIVGIDITIVNPAKNFIILFKLFDIIVPKTSIVLLKMLLYILAISIACLFSIITSSKTSISSSYKGIRSIF